jgi:single-stranded-DNA-specific exonuclease
MDPARLRELRDYLEDKTKDATFELEEARVLEIDGALAPGAATGELLEMIDRIGPFGSNAPEPLFAVPNVRAAGARRVGENHVAFDLVGEDGARLRAIAFRVADGPEGLAIQRGEPLHIAGRLRPDSWRGPGKVQIEVADVALTG